MREFLEIACIAALVVGIVDVTCRVLLALLIKTHDKDIHNS